MSYLFMISFCFQNCLKWPLTSTYFYYLTQNCILCQRLPSGLYHYVLFRLLVIYIKLCLTALRIFLWSCCSLFCTQVMLTFTIFFFLHGVDKSFFIYFIYLLDLLPTSINTVVFVLLSQILISQKFKIVFEILLLKVCDINTFA